MICTVCKDPKGGASKWKDGTVTHLSCRITGPAKEPVKKVKKPARKQAKKRKR